MADTGPGSMRLGALVAGVLGVILLAVAIVFGLQGQTVEVPGQRSYDCGSLFGRLGGADAENQWGEDSDLFRLDDPTIAEDVLPRVTCQDATDDQESVVYGFTGVGAVLLVAAIVLLVVTIVRSRGPRPDPDDSGTTPEAAA